MAFTIGNAIQHTTKGFSPAASCSDDRAADITDSFHLEVGPGAVGPVFVQDTAGSAVVLMPEAGAPVSPAARRPRPTSR